MIFPVVILKTVFWLCALALIHSYVLYPLLLRLLVVGRTNNQDIFKPVDELPFVSILIAAYNEEALIKEKIESIFQSNYPLNMIEVLIGSDNSSDRTNEIIIELSKKYPQVKLHAFLERQGKIRIINKLKEESRGTILMITDANVMFDTDTIYELVKHFKNPKISLVDSNMLHKGLNKEGISIQEKTYIQAEVFIKNAEGKVWGTMMGPFGGCYALRKDHFVPVPENFLVDDFYINMKALEKGGQCINEPNAKVYEDVPNDLSEEFRRKVRIATGNFQNLSVFMHLLFRFNGMSFSFFSHKVLRWFGPVFMLLAFLCSLALMHYFNFYFWVLCGSLALLFIPFLDSISKSSGNNITLFRFITHFLTMNLALFIGMFKFLGGVKNSVWEPTKRNQ